MTIRTGLTVIHSYRQCMYIVFIVQCKKNSKTSAKIRRTSIISIIFKGVFLLCSCYTVISFYCLLYRCMNQVPGDFYIYTRWLKHKFIRKPLLYRRCHYCRITTIIGCLLIRITCLSCVDCYINELIRITCLSCVDCYINELIRITCLSCVDL